MNDKTLFFNKTLKKIEFIFYFAGINIKDSEIKGINKTKSRIIYVINLIWSCIDLAGAIFWFVDGVQTGKDLLGLTSIAPCICLSALARIKALLLILNEKHVHKLIENLRNSENNARKRELSVVEIDTMNKEKNFLNIVITVIKSLYTVLVILFALSPILIMTVKYLSTAELELMLPFLVLYPFDPFQLKAFPFVYFHQVWTAFLTCVYIISADCFFFICCTYIRIQFKLLQYNVGNIIPVQHTNEKFLNNDQFSAKFKELVLWHQNLIDSVQILEKIYSKSTLVNFASSSMIICLSSFNVTMMGDDMAFVATFLSFLVMALFQVFFLCFFADLLMAASMEISEAVYKAQWYMAEPSIAKKLSIMQIRGHKPCKLTAYGFADVNLNSFMRVLSTAWSYFALLQTIYGN